MSDLSQSTVAFLDTMQLEPGSKRIYTFASQKEADSFRVSCYAVKRKTRDNTVLIAISGNAVTLSKALNAVEISQIDPDGTVTNISQERALSDYQKRVEEIIADSEGLDERLKADFIREAIAQLNRRAN